MSTYQPERMALFALEYLKDFNASRAARVIGVPPAHAGTDGRRWLAREEVQALIAAAIAERKATLKIETNDVLRLLWDTATADVNELIDHRRVGCRCCWGIEFKYQRTVQEMARARAEFTRLGLDHTDTFDELGGTGYDRTREPNAECTECSGEGESVVFAKDTRYLSPGARALFAGVKQTKEGIELKFHSRDKALELVGKHLGMFTDVVEHKGEVVIAERIRAARKRAPAE